MVENLGFQVGDAVLDGDQYEARIVEINADAAEATLDYSEFPADVPAEATVWSLDELELADEDDELNRRQDLNAEGLYPYDNDDAY